MVLEFGIECFDLLLLLVEAFSKITIGLVRAVKFRGML